MPEKVYTAVGHPNIALTKYWGQRKGSAANLPNNSTISVTLGGPGDPIFTITSVAFSSRLDHDKFYVDGNLEENPKGAQSVLRHMRRIAGLEIPALVVSYNSFLKSAGMASSASSSATLAYASSEALGLGLGTRDLSIGARFGSGSAARSVISGIAKWNKGIRDDGLDSYAVQVAPPSYWPELVDLIVLISGKEKKVSSSDGHERAVHSPFYEEWAKLSERQTTEVEDAVMRKDFDTLAGAVMLNSNSMHSVALSSPEMTWYLTDRSIQIIYAIKDLNTQIGRKVAAYTFDAGPNAHIVTTDTYLKEIKSILRDKLGETQTIESKAGEGPLRVSSGPSLIDESTLSPVFYEREQLIREVARARLG